MRARLAIVAAATVLTPLCSVGCSNGAGLVNSSPATKPPYISGSTASVATSPVDGVLRGFYSPLTYWDRSFTVTNPAECIAQGIQGADDLGSPLNDATAPNRAWRLPSGALACVSSRDNSPVRVIDLTFDPSVDSRTALAAVTSILPVDTLQIASYDGVKARPFDGTEPRYPNGSCKEIVYTSESLATEVTTTDPQVASQDDPHRVNVWLFSGNASYKDGSDRPFDSNSVHLASLVYGAGDEPDPTGKAAC